MENNLIEKQPVRARGLMPPLGLEDIEWPSTLQQQREAPPSWLQILSLLPNLDSAVADGRPFTKDDVTVVIPTLNEEEGIGNVLTEAKAEGYRNIIVVDGYSTDETTRIANRLGARVILQNGAGKTGAISTAIKNVSTPLTLVIDGDATYDPKDIDSMLAHAKDFDLIVGRRSNRKENIPTMNRLGNWAITKAFNLMFGSNLSDVCSGMYLFRTSAGRLLDFNGRGFSAEVELASQMAAEGSVTEVPISYRERLGKRKLSPLGDGLKIFASLFGLARRHNPTLLFTATASLAAIPGFILLGWVAYVKFVSGVFHTGYAIFGTMLVLAATQAFSIATISLLLKRTERRIARRLSPVF